MLGIDEAGRGCWAGPLVAAAVRLRDPIHGLDDSKRLGPDRRVTLARKIRQAGADIGIGWVSAPELDELGLTAAVALAMERALSRLVIEQGEPVIIDGNYNYLPHILTARAVVKADARVAAVSAASIIAKTARDVYMQRLSLTLPHYGFEQHVGYGTAMHMDRLRSHGASRQHRQSYAPIERLMYGS